MILGLLLEQSFLSLVMPDELLVSDEFLAEQLCQTMPKPAKTGGPYPVHAKKTRRDEVFKLHFDYGYSARKIAETMKINRNTINSDISHLYSQLDKEDGNTTAEDWINKMLYRFETKRTRLMEKLDKAESLDDSMSIEKMLFEIDSKIVQVVMKIQTSNQSLYDVTMKMFNNWLEKNGYKERYVLWGETLKISEETSRKVTQLIRSDKYQISPEPKRYDSGIHSGNMSQAKF